ncbi:hypothetical protein vseg_001963 [Gypsophila vaccaria]
MKVQIHEAGPTGHPRDSWIHLVDYWYSEKGKRLVEYGKEARASQNHVHTTGCTSYANIRADFIDADANVFTQIECNPSNTKPRVQIENEDFNKLMYGDEVPKRPLGYG